MLERRGREFGRGHGGAIFLFSMGLLLYELCLTRVLSVVFYYHTAFLAISLAMLGLGAGGVWVYLWPERFRRGIEGWMLFVGGAVALQVFVLSLLRFDIALLERMWSREFLPIFVLVALTCWLPFLGGGIVWAYWFRRFQKKATQVYAWDLIGAAVGALALVPVMGWFGGLGGMLFCAMCVALSAFISAHAEHQRGRSWFALGCYVAFGLLCFAQVGWGVMQIQVDMVKKRPGQSPILFKKWNAFSRVVVLSDQGWYRGLSDARKKYWKGRTPRQIDALIDINAFAPIMAFDGDLRKSLFLRELVSNVAHHLLPPKRDVLILGPGGGKDVLGALHFQPRQVVGIELNPILINDVMLDRFRAFSGDLYHHPKVRILLGEGRATLTRLRQKFDVIIANSVVTWAANSSGAMDLAEHHLYTEEACDLYLKRLRAGGILSVSLWDISAHALPLRWITTCEAAARKSGIKSLREHVAVIANPWDQKAWFATILISKTPWTHKQKQTLMKISGRWGFQPLFMEGYDRNAEIFGDYFRAPKALLARLRQDIRPATDDRPFFLYTVRWQEALKFWKLESWEEDAAFINLLVSLVLVSVLLVLIVLVPLGWRQLKKREVVGMSFREIVYFLGIGFGFMLIEIPLIQRLTLFLGHPTYALTVVLAGLLLWCGLGSLWSSRWTGQGRLFLETRLVWLLGGLVVLLYLLHFVLDAVLPIAMMWTIVPRILLVLVLLLPFGVAMGMPLPLGMTRFEGRETAVPWAWGINGASSVVASILAIWIAAEWGFRVAFYLATGCYLLVWCCAWLDLKALRRDSQSG